MTKLSSLTAFFLISFSCITDAQTITIGKQVWMTHNLNVRTFRNGDTIPQAKTDEEWEKADKNKQPAWCYNENIATNGIKYGKLYNWYAVNDPRGLAPIGYHIPTNDEWTILINYLGGEDEAGKKMKSTSGWKDNGNGTNESGFSGLPGGYRYPSSEGSFESIGSCGGWWSSTEMERDTVYAEFRIVRYDGEIITDAFLKICGFSVRCLKD